MSVPAKRIGQRRTGGMWLLGDSTGGGGACKGKGYFPKEVPNAAPE